MIDIGSLIIRYFGPEAAVSGLRPVSGGDINDAYLVSLSDGRQFFLKENSRQNADFFRAEVQGLKAIRETNVIRVPEVIDTGIISGRSYMLMEYLPGAKKITGYWERFGRELAAMHRAPAIQITPGGKYGFTEDNYIGAGEQTNTIKSSWIEFFRDCRLAVQFRRAVVYLDSSDRNKAIHLMDHLEDYLCEPKYPSLLHGDLWSGNFVTGPDGCACLIDPAVYVGHAEADLAMTELFGGFSSIFYDSYREANGIEAGYEDRRDLYNLYHLLNHLNLFGGGYYGSVMRIVRRYTGD
ncbi:MAG: fructosamine kinase family protein [Eubacterium sp.]|nr:fructosamine kinase family protein [Eubacterium sp.]